MLILIKRDDNSRVFCAQVPDVNNFSRGVPVNIVSRSAPTTSKFSYLFLSNVTSLSVSSICGEVTTYQIFAVGFWLAKLGREETGRISCENVYSLQANSVLTLKHIAFC